MTAEPPNRHAPSDSPEGPQGAPPPGRERAFNIPGVVIAFAAICIIIHLVRLYLLSPEQDFVVLIDAAFIPVRYSGRYLIDVYAFTSPFTYSLLHGGFAHLAVNLIWLAAFGSPLASRLGAPRFVVFWFFTAAAAALLHYVLHMDSEGPLIGASGSISGMMGAAARFGFRADRSSGRSIFAGPLLSIPDTFRSRTVVTFLAVWMVVNLATGLATGVPGADGAIAWEAHIGGFLAGFLAIRLFDGRPPLRR